MPPKPRTKSTTEKTAVNADEREEYFLTTLGLHPFWTKLPDDSRECRLRLWASVSLGELTREDAEYLEKRHVEYVVHTASEVDRYEHFEALLCFARYADGRHKKRHPYFESEEQIQRMHGDLAIIMIEPMKKLVKEAATLRSLYPTQAASAPHTAPQYEGVYNSQIGATDTDIRRWHLKSKESNRNKNKLWADIAKEEGIPRGKDMIRKAVERYAKERE